MNNFRKSKPAKGGRTAERPRSLRPNNAVQKFDAVCSKCGKKCQVPFRPSNTKPVYCKDCFGAPQQSQSIPKNFSPASSTSSEGKTIGDLTRQIAAMNAKIDTMLKIIQEKA